MIGGVNTNLGAFNRASASRAAALLASQPQMPPPPPSSSPERSPPAGHLYPLPLGCDPSYVAGAHPFARLYAANGGRIGKANTRADCPCVGPAGQNAQPHRCHSYGAAAFRDLFGRCEGAITWARTHCVGNPRCDHKVGYWGPDGVELGRDSPLVLFQWYLANRPDRDCEGCGCEHGDGTCAGCLDVQGCPQPCQADLDAALPAPPRALPVVPPEAVTPRTSPRPATVGDLSTHPLPPAAGSLREAQGAMLGGTLYVFGGFVDGWSRMSADAWACDLRGSTPRWTPLPRMPLAAQGNTHAGNAADEASQTIYLAGGMAMRAGRQGLDDVYTADDVLALHTPTATWKRLPPLPAPRFGGGLALLDGELHFASGGTVDGSRAGGRADAFTADHDQHWALSLADPTRGWRARAAVPVRANHMAAATLGSYLYLLGGQSRGAEGCSNKDDVYRYSAATDAWERLPPMLRPRGHIASSVLPYGDGLLVVGGVHDRRDGGCASLLPARGARGRD